MLFDLWLVASAGIVKDGTRELRKYWCLLVSSLLGSGSTLPQLELKMATECDQLDDLFITAETLPALRSQLVSLICYAQSPSLGNILTMSRLTSLQLSTELGNVAHTAWKLPALRQLELVSCKGSLDAFLVNGSLSQLERLSAVGCPLGGEVLVSLTRFTTLRELALRNCGLQQLPTLAALQQLRLLDLSDNAGLTDLLPALALTALTCLMLEGVVPLHSSFVQAVEKLPGVSLVWIENKSRTTFVLQHQLPEQNHVFTLRQTVWRRLAQNQRG